MRQQSDQERTLLATLAQLDEDIADADHAQAVMLRAKYELTWSRLVEHRWQLRVKRGEG